MPAFQYLTRTLHPPLTADGHNVKNSFGIVIATANSTVVAQALAELANLGVPSAKAAEDEYERDQNFRAKLLGHSIPRP